MLIIFTALYNGKTSVHIPKGNSLRSISVSRNKTSLTFIKFSQLQLPAERCRRRSFKLEWQIIMRQGFIETYRMFTDNTGTQGRLPEARSVK